MGTPLAVLGLFLIACNNPSTESQPGVKDPVEASRQKREKTVVEQIHPKTAEPPPLELSPEERERLIDKSEKEATHK